MILENIRKVFALYVTFPKNRWNEIKKAETDEAAYKKLMEEYSSGKLFNRKVRPELNSSLDKNVLANEIFVNDEEAIVI